MRQPIFKSPDDGNFFVGYYDKSPFDRCNRRHLAMRVGDFSKLPDASSVAEIGYFDIQAGGGFNPCTSTNTFNWQQGCMLQWLDDLEPGSIIFNRLIDGAFRSVVFNLSDQQSRILDMPIYAIRPQGDIALTIDFERHYWCRRAYAYDGIQAVSKDARVVPGDGIFRIDLSTGRTTQLLQVADLLSIKPLTSMNEAVHYVEHISFSPNGQQFVFYHRWKARDGSIACRLFKMDLQSPNLQMLLDSGRLSHMCWLDDRRILAWGSPSVSLGGALIRSGWMRKWVVRPLRPLYSMFVRGNPKFGQSKVSRLVNGDSYFVLDVETGTSQRVLNALDRDGHPSPAPGGTMITDTYPDLESNAKVLWGNPATGETRDIAVVASMPEYDNTPVRCDLHPKISKDGSLVSIDRMEKGRRSIEVYLTGLESAA